jgi:hypothetical protein
MKLFFIIILSVLCGCHFSDKKDSKNTIHFDTVKAKSLDISFEKSNLNYDIDTVSLEYINIEYKDVNHDGKCSLKWRLPRHSRYYIIKSKEDANEIFEQNYDFIKTIDFNKYVLIGAERPTNGSENVSKKVFSISKSKTILVKINVSYLRNEMNIAYRFQTWIIIEKPKADWEIKVLIN